MTEPITTAVPEDVFLRLRNAGLDLDDIRELEFDVHPERPAVVQEIRVRKPHTAQYVNVTITRKAGT